MGEAVARRGIRIDAAGVAVQLDLHLNPFTINFTGPAGFFGPGAVGQLGWSPGAYEMFFLNRDEFVPMHDPLGMWQAFHLAIRQVVASMQLTSNENQLHCNATLIEQVY